MKTIDDALELRGRIFGAFEIAELEPDAAAREPWLTFAIVGAGPTGVELAGQIAELSRRALRGNFRRFDPKDARIVLLDARRHACWPATRSVCAAARSATSSGSAWRSASAPGSSASTKPASTSLSGDGDTGRIEARTKIWAAGVQGSPLGRLLADRAGASVDRAGRVEVQPDCSLPGHPELFVVGDLMSLNGLPGLAEVAMQSGRHAARDDRAPTARHASPSRSATSISAPWRRSRGSARSSSIGRLAVRGLRRLADVARRPPAFLVGFKNRVAAVANWAVAFLGRGRRQRTITKQQVFARARGLESRDAARAEPTSELETTGAR